MGKIEEYGGRTVDDYYIWLCNIIPNEWRYKSYLLLFKDLHSMTFIWSIPNDDNRARDALELRQEYLGYIDDLSEVSVLEVLITIARHMGDNLYDPDKGDQTEGLFWGLINNLELDIYDDDSYNGSNIHSILYNWIHRRYGRDGIGGLFPLRRAKKDQRKVELWYQMSAYLLENYEF